jgi:hypothetical protein
MIDTDIKPIVTASETKKAGLPRTDLLRLVVMNKTYSGTIILMIKARLFFSSTNRSI